ncbi:hypothetical protein, partial [Microcoleus sp. D3_18a_C4]|uniref:hypothetical protein n=1 Tax=Microcoleus sp. D3_18a_C4 TaxID=3055332 RepID=UPI002FD70A19
MKTRLRKQDHHDLAPLTETPVQAKSLSPVRPMENSLGSPQIAATEDTQTEQQQEKQGFNFAEMPIFAGTAGELRPRVQAKFFKGDRSGNVAQPPVQRQEIEEEPMQGKLEPIQRTEGEEEEPAQAKLEPVQRTEGEEEDPAQAKLEPIQRTEG